MGLLVNGLQLNVVSAKDVTCRQIFYTRYADRMMTVVTELGLDGLESILTGGVNINNIL